MSEGSSGEISESPKTAHTGRRPFPQHTLEEAFAVAKAIQDKNAGKPWKPILLANALGIKSGSSNFRDITSSSNRYGLTAGTWQSEFISLTPLGTSLTKPTKAEKEIKDRQDAVLKIDVFNKIYDYYRDSKLPSSSDKFFKNMVETEFGVPSELVDECIRILIENGKYSNILRELQGSLCVIFSETPQDLGEPKTPESLTEMAPTAAPSETPTLPKPSEPIPAKAKANQIFVIHGKNKTPLEQLKKILAEPFNIPFKVAIDEPHVGRPISQKVKETMENCTSAIVIFTADEEYTNAKGEKVFRPSDNAVYELGAASILYDKKIVILKEDCVTLESDFSDLGHITFEKDRLDAKATDLMKELLGFGLLKVIPA
jgi:hypothetical protein